MAKRKLRKSVKLIFILFIILLIVIAFFLMNSEKKEGKKETKKEVKIIEREEKDEIRDKLINIGYSNEEIELIKKSLSDEHISYVIDNNINDIMFYVNDKYYIDDYLMNYINYRNNNKELDSRNIIELVNTHRDKVYYKDIEETNTSLGKYVLLNKYYYANENYPSEGLIDVSSEYNLYGSSFKLNKECYEAFLKMYNDAKEAGYGFKINSAYRSYETQVVTYNGWVNKDGVELADTYSARAGHSEHQTGYAFDIRDYPFTNDDYSKTKSFEWVSSNAYKYGFIIRFPKNKENITGYQYESWHYRYCGIQCATYIYNNDITFDEYYEYFIKYNNPGKINLP